MTFILNNKKMIGRIFLLLFVTCCMLLAGCTVNTAKGGTDASDSRQLPLSFATQFSAESLEGGYWHIHVEDGTDYIVVPEGFPDQTFSYPGAVIIRQPVSSVYLAASSAMDLFVQLDALDTIATCSTKAEDYSIEEAAEKIGDGTIKYVGKYSAPDYETILASGCTLAVESTMILHAPSIKEELERLSIPVVVERSSYETDPLGRLEWIKFYGILLGKEQEACDFYEREAEKVRQVTETAKGMPGDNAKPEVAFFYISSNGYVNVRKPGDYVSKMIELAGGTYCPNDLDLPEENALSTVNINWEDFYLKARDADILIYNATIDEGIYSVEDLVAKSALFADFKAVKNDAVFCTKADMFQKSSAVADIITDLNHVIAGGEDEDLTYLYHVNGQGMQ